MMDWRVTLGSLAPESEVKEGAAGEVGARAAAETKPTVSIREEESEDEREDTHGERDATLDRRTL